jgi:hypothetical protein
MPTTTSIGPARENSQRKRITEKRGEALMNQHVFKKPSGLFLFISIFVIVFGFLGFLSCPVSHSTDLEEERGKNQIDSSSLTEEEQEKERLKKEVLKAIKETDKPLSLKVYLQEPDYEIRKAAVARLGEIGGEESVRILADTFEKEPRATGIMLCLRPELSRLNHSQVLKPRKFCEQ